MEKVQDGNLYPRPYRSSAVITRDVNGSPTLTRFYSGENQTGFIMFEWVQTNYAIAPILNESFTSNFAAAVELGNTKIEEDSEVVTTANGETTFVKDIDYTMDYTAGTIKALKTTVSIEDEAVVAGVAEVAVELAHINMDEAVAAVVKSADGETTYTATTDYVIDYANGTIAITSEGGMVAETSYLISYDYISGMTDTTEYNVNYDYIIANTIGKTQKFSLQNINKTN